MDLVYNHDVGLQWVWLTCCAVFSVCSMFYKEQGITVIVSCIVYSCNLALTVVLCFTAVMLLMLLQGVCLMFDVVVHCGVDPKCLITKGYLISKVCGSPS